MTALHERPAMAVVVRYRVLGGAEAMVYESTRDTDRHRYGWRCLGCGAGSPYPDTREHAEERANTHAAECRAAAPPQVDEQALPLADGEVAAVRAELARADSKAAALAGLGGGALAILAAASAAAPSGPVAALLAAAVVAGVIA